MKKLFNFYALLLSTSLFSQVPILHPSNSITGIGQIDSPQSENVSKLIDGNVNTKFLDFEFSDGMGVDIYTGALSIVTQFSITTANDAQARDPQNYNIYGSTDGEQYSLITSGTIPCVSTRLFSRAFDFLNTNSYSYYRFIFTNQCGEENSLQVSEVQLYGTIGEVFFPLADEIQQLCPNSTIANITAVGQNLTWYDSINGENSLPLSHSLVDGETYYVSQTISGIESPRIGVTVQIVENIIHETTVSDACVTYYWEITNVVYNQSGTYTFTNDCVTEILNLTVTTLQFYLDVDNDGFGNSDEIYQDCQLLDGFSLVGGDCNDENNAVNPSATEICGDGIDNNCNGQVDENCGLTSIQSSQCGTILPKITDYIYANLVPNAQGYRFRVTDVVTGEIQTIDKFLRVFQLTQLPNYRFDTTYLVDVDVKINNNWQNNYGSSCEINTLNVIPEIDPSICGQSISNPKTIIYASYIPYVSGYRFSVTDNTTQIEYIFDRPLRSLGLSRIPELSFGKEYTIKVAAKNTDGTYMPYSVPCNFFYDEQNPNLKLNNDSFDVVSYPNPFENKFKIEFNSNHFNDSTIKVYDVLGNLIENKKIDQTNYQEVSFGDGYPSGIYTVVVSQDDNYKMIRVIKR